MDIKIDNNAIGNIDSVSNGDVFGLKSDSSPYALPFQFENYYDDRAVKKFIQSVEKLIRTSREYNSYIESLRTNIYALNHDVIQGEITTADVDLEFHHYPLTLYEIVEICMLTHIDRMEHFTTFSLAKEIMNYHFKNEIGIVPLTKTNHELVHDGKLFISTKQIFGNYKKFIEDHKDGISAEIMNNIATIEYYSNQNIANDFQRILEID